MSKDFANVVCWLLIVLAILGFCKFIHFNAIADCVEYDLKNASDNPCSHKDGFIKQKPDGSFMCSCRH